MKAFLFSFILMLAATAQAQSQGSLEVRGEAGRFQIFQKVKAIRCKTNYRGACDGAVFFDLNKPQALPAGSYIVGFENSLYPGWVHITAGRSTVLKLEKVIVPSHLKGSKFRVYRDMGQGIEQNKILFSMFYMSRHFFRLDKENFGDLYLTGAWERDFVQRLTYETCARITDYRNVPEAATSACASYNEAARFSDLSALYKFSSDGTLLEYWVTFPGDVITIKHPRYLVGAPMTNSDFVAVFPGAYRVQAEGKGAISVQVRVGSDIDFVER